MKAFRYTALNPEGRRLTATGYATNAGALRDQLIEARVHPVSIRKALFQDANRLRLTEAEAARFARDIAQLLGSGISIAQALSLLQSRETPRVAAVAREVRSRLTAGEPLSRALEAAAGRPARFLQALARAGEASGRQSDVLAAGGASLKAADQLKKRLTTLSIYPAFVILVALGSIAVYAYAVLPSLEPAFEGLGDDMPSQTRTVLVFGAVIRTVMPALAALAVSLTLAATLSSRFRRAAYTLLANALMRPRRSPLRDYVFANLASRLAVMLQAGVPLAAAWKLAHEPVTIGGLSRQLAAQDSRLMEGARLSDAFRAIKSTPADLIQYVSLGEQSARVPMALADAADVMGARAQEAIERVLSVVTPVVIIAVGGMVGLITMMVFQGLLAVGDAVA